MATDGSKNSSCDQILFSEWQFVGKGKNNDEFSDDESIEIIEREILCSETPSSCSEEEEEKEDKPEVVLVEENEPKNGEWVVPFESESCICLDGDGESVLNVPSEIKTSQIDTDETTLHCSYASAGSHVTPFTINNLSRKVVYSCVLAAVISIIIYQYRGNLFSILLNRANETKCGGTDYNLPDNTLCTRTELKEKPEDFEFSSGEAVIQDLVNKKIEQFKKLNQKYKMIVSNTYISSSNIYAVDVSDLRKLLVEPTKHLPTPVSKPCEENVDNIKIPKVCMDSSGKQLLYMTKKEYNSIVRLLLGTAQFDKDEELYSYLLDTFKKVDRTPEINRQMDFFNPVKNPITSEEHFSDMAKISAKNSGAATNTNEAESFDNIEKTDTESKLREVIEEVRALYRKIKDQVENLDRFWTSCADNKHDSCILKGKPMSKENETFSNEAKQINITHSEDVKTDSVLQFIYQTPPVTDRWTLKMDSKTTINTNHHDKPSEELLGKTSKAREKYRKRNKEKNSRKKSQKTHNLNDETEHKLYKRYKEFLSQTREKIKVDFRKFASHFKSKLKKFGDGVKGNYEKLISSDWKHYAKSVFQSFHF